MLTQVLTVVILELDETFKVIYFKPYVLFMKKNWVPETKWFAQVT